MKIIFLILLTLFFFTTSVKSAIAIVDPLTFPNNRFGIHITDENDLAEAAELVNGGGGEWGYVTVVIRQDDQNIDTLFFLTNQTMQKNGEEK